jgi:hypothetical protein
MRFQALMPDILHWLGIKKIDRMLSMSNMKHDAIVDSGIKIIERIPSPEEMIPSDSRVEIDAKINAGYFTTGKQFTMDELAQVKGRGWEKWEDITVSIIPGRSIADDSTNPVLALIFAFYFWAFLFCFILHCVSLHVSRSCPKSGINGASIRI